MWFVIVLWHLILAGALLRQAAGRVMPLVREAPDMVRVDAHHVDADAVRSMVAAWFIEAANRTWN